MTPVNSPHLDPAGFIVIDLETFVKDTPLVTIQQQETPKTKPIMPKILVAADHVLDLVPIGSTASNLVNLGLKHVVFKDVDPEFSEYKEYLKHLKEKQTTTCLVYSIPVIGNVLKLGVSGAKLAAGILMPQETKLKIELSSSREALKNHPIMQPKNQAASHEEGLIDLNKITI